jgi:glycosyltransferase involved in cell wall biosynthesis
MIYSTGFPPKEGIARHVHNLSTRLAERGHSVVAITRGSGRRSYEVSKSYRVEVLPHVPVYPFHLAVQRWFAQRLLSKMDRHPEIVHIHSPNSPLIQTVAPVVTTFHSPMRTDASFVEVIDLTSLGTRLLAGFTVLNEYRLIKRSSAVCAVSKNVAMELATYGIRTESVAVVGNGVDINHFHPIHEDMADRSPYLLYVGRLAYRKGLFDIIDAAKLLHEGRAGIRVKVAGEGPLTKKLSRYSDRVGASANVDFLGRVSEDELVELYSGALATVIASRYESGPLVLLEALSCGSPVISTPVGIAPDIVADGVCGFMVKVASPGAIAQAAEDLNRDPERKARMSTNARKVVLAGHSWDAVTDRVEAVYEKVTNP